MKRLTWFLAFALIFLLPLVGDTQGGHFLPSYTTAGLPAAGFAGRQAYVSDTQRVVIDNGTAWQDPNAARLLIVTSAGNTCAANTVLCINANNNPTQSHPQTVQINNCNTGETFGLCLSPPANGQDGLAIFRWTDTAPSGNLIYVANLADTFTILSLDVNGNLATCLPANCGAGTGNVYVGGTLFAPNGAPAGTGASISSAQTVNGNDTLLLTRKTDTSPTGNYIRALNAAQNATMFTLNMDGSITLNGVTFNNLGTPADGTIQRCIDCDPPTVVDNTCTHAGAQTGAMALRINGAWKCVG